MQNKIFQVVVPTEEEIELRDGQRRTVERRIFPGYILVDMAWMKTPGTSCATPRGHWVCWLDPQAYALRQRDVDRVLKRMRAETPRVKVTFRPVKRSASDGPFEDFVGLWMGSIPTRARYGSWSRSLAGRPLWNSTFCRLKRSSPVWLGRLNGKEGEGNRKTGDPGWQGNTGAAGGPALGQHGINIMAFCKDYNARTAHMAGSIIPAEITIFQDNSFRFILKTPPATDLLKKAAGFQGRQDVAWKR